MEPLCKDVFPKMAPELLKKIVHITKKKINFFPNLDP